MKQKSVLVMYVAAALVLGHALLIVGCGRTPLLGILGTSLSVGVGRM